MKIVRHTATDMRQALRSSREQLGEEAVILSSRRLAQGVEVTAAVDFDAGSLEKAVPLAAPESRPSSRPVNEHALARLPQQEPPASHERASPAAAAALPPLFEPPPEAPAEAMGKELQTL